MEQKTLKLPRVAPSAAGLDANAVLDFLDACECAGIELHSLMIAVDGRVAAEGWWHPYAPGLRHGCYSVTKTFTASAVGFAAAEGLLRTDDTLDRFFPEHVKPGQDANLRLLTVHDLLRMSCGQDAEVDLAQTDDAVAAFMDAKFPNRPGTVFRYNSVASHMLGEIIRRQTGKTLPEYLEPRLFAPLGITDVRWDRTPQGVPMGGWGIHLRTEDLLKMGMLFLQHGRWNGRQVLPAGWAELASAKKIDNAGPDSLPEWAQGYCYQMWRNVTPGSFRLDGAFGQLSMVYPEQNAVITITSATQKVNDIFEAARGILLPGITGKPLSQPYADRRLTERLANLNLGETGRVCRDAALEAKLGRAEIVFKKNGHSLIPSSQRGMFYVRKVGIEKLRLHFCGENCLLSWTEGETEHEAKIGLAGRYAESELALPCALDPLLSVGWCENGAFRFVLRAAEEPHAIQVSITPGADDSVCLAYFDALDPMNRWTEMNGVFWQSA